MIHAQIDDIDQALADGRTINPTVISQLTGALRDAMTRGEQLVGERDRLEQRVGELTAEPVPALDADELREKTGRALGAVTTCTQALAELSADDRARVLHAAGILVGLRPGG